jgi:hypothetical protein
VVLLMIDSRHQATWGFSTLRQYGLLTQVTCTYMYISDRACREVLTWWCRLHNSVVA